MSVLDIISDFFKKCAQNPEKVENKIRVHEYIGKFVKQNSVGIGESIAVENGRLIVKNSDSILSIPLAAVSANTDNIVVGDFNMEESLNLGKEWFDRRDALKFDEKGLLIK